MDIVRGENVFKLATIFLLITSIALLFGGTASAALTVNVTVVNNNGVPITVTHPGTEGGIDIVASTHNESVKNPQALITTKPSKGLVYNIKNAMMIVNGGKSISNSDPKFGNFLMWSDQDEAWFWAISQVTGPLGPKNTVKLFIPVNVDSTGKITTNAIFEGGILDNGPTPAENSYTFISTSKSNNNNSGAETSNDTIPMQNTGAPLVIGALGLLSVLGGTLYSRRK